MNEYYKQAKDFMTKHRITIKKIQLDTRPPKWEDNPRYNRFRYQIIVTKKPQNKSLTFKFWDSINNFYQNKRPTNYDILACLSMESYVYEDFEDFCSSLGYSSDSIKALRTFKEVNRFAKRINKFFTSVELEELREIN